jgi:hypothetical protein
MISGSQQERRVKPSVYIYVCGITPVAGVASESTFQPLGLTQNRNDRLLSRKKRHQRLSP